MSNLEKAKSPTPVSPPPLRTWDFAETAFVSLIAYAVFGLTSRYAVAIALAMYDGANTSSAAQFQAYGAGYIVASPLTIAVVWYAIRLADRDFAEYLALNWPSPGELVRALAITAILLLVEVWTISVVDPAGVSSNPYAHANWGLLTFMIGGC